MSELDENFSRIWNEETGKVYDEFPMLTWEACEMIAYVNLMKKDNHENLDR
jgi:hypothetical protein